MLSGLHLDDPLPAVRVEALLLEDHLSVVVLALGVGQAHHGQQLGAAQRPQDVRVVVQTEHRLQELNERRGVHIYSNLQCDLSMG